MKLDPIGWTLLDADIRFAVCDFKKRYASAKPWHYLVVVISPGALKNALGCRGVPCVPTVVNIHGLSVVVDPDMEAGLWRVVQIAEPGMIRAAG